MRLRLTLATLTVVVMLAASAGPPPVGGAEPIPTPQYSLYLPLVAVPPPTPTATATPTATPLPTVTPTRTHSAACMGDEAMSFAPNPGATGSPMAVSVTSASPSVYVALQVAYGSAGVALAGPTVTSGGKGYVWTWTFTPYQPRRYDASFYVNQSDFCAGGFVQVNGNALPTATRTATPRATATPRPPTATPTAAPTAPPGVEYWDGRLNTLLIGITGASVAPGQKYWKVTKGIFQNHIEGGGGINISVDVLGEDGQRLTLGVGTVVGVVNGRPDLTWDAKPPDVYPMNYPMGPDSLGAYTVWLTFEGLPSERVYGMGLVSSDGTDAPLEAKPGRVHVNYLITFRRTTRSATIMALAPRKLGCYPGWRAWQSPLNQNGLLNDLFCDQLPKTPLSPYHTRPGL